MTIIETTISFFDAQCDKELAEQLLLGTWREYEYVNQSGCTNISGVDDAKKFEALRLALNVLQVPADKIEAIFSVISAVLWLGNLQFRVRAIRPHFSYQRATNCLVLNYA